ncbi:MAG TPA: class I SAM-dependent methyltransferase [Casimicrobiaceae bacterium]|nr:class I SAM-dependent methyltransferase [Casimicrobiaceae bacterium]
MRTNVAAQAPDCRVCAAAPLRYVKLLHGEYWHDDVPLFCCQGCRCWFTFPQRLEGATDLSRVNSVEWHLRGLAHNERKIRALLDLLDRRRWAQGTPRRFLDIGCALGHAVAEAARRGYEAVGIEPEASAADYARRVMGVRVESTFFRRGVLGDDPFDVVVLDNVLEHVPDPGALVHDIAVSLRPGGVLFLGVPPVEWIRRLMSVSWWMPSSAPTRDWRGALARSRVVGFLAWRDTFGFPNGHINYFSERGIRALAHGHGLRVEQQFHAQAWRPVVYPWLGLTTGYWILRKPD